MNYKNKFYEKYVSGHTANLYGDSLMGDIKNQFPIFQAYFGKFFPKNKNARILDLGCGDGSFVYWLQKRGFENSEGIDVSREQIDVAKKLNIKNISRADAISFLKGKTGEYDLIFARDFLEHFSKDELLELGMLINSSLKRGGVFITQTVNAENLLWGRLRYGDFTHDLAFTEQSIKQLLRVARFSHIEVYPQRPVVHGTKSFIRYIVWRIIELLLKSYLLVETGSGKGIFTQNLIVKAEK